MASGKPLVYYLMDDSGHFYYINTSGDVDTTTTPTAIQGILPNSASAPDGWRDTEIKYTRNMTYWGVFRKLSTPYRFNGKSAKIIRYLAETYGVNAYCQLRIDKLKEDGTAASWEYFTLYTGELDFTNYDGSKPYVTINILEGGLNDLLDANKNVVYEIPIDPGDSDLLYFDGCKLQAVQHYIGTAYYHVQDANNAVPLPLFYYSQDGEYPVGDGGFVQPGGPAGLENYILFSAYRDEDLTFHYKGTITFYNDGASTNSATPEILIEIYADKESVPSGVPLDFPYPANVFWNDTTPITPGNNTTFNIDQTFGAYTFAPGNVVVMYARMRYTTVATGDAYEIDIVNGATLDITAEFVTPESYVNAYRYSQLWAKVVDKMTNGAYTGTTAYLTDGSITADDAFGNVPWSTMAMCGDAIRGAATPVIKTSTNDVYKAANVIWGCGVGIEGDNLILEPISYFLDNTVEICNLGLVSGFDRMFVTELMGTSFNIGYQTQNTKALNGKEAFNTTQGWKLPFKKLSNIIDWTTPYSADMFPIENLRTNISNTATTDNVSDNTVYLVEANIDLMTGLVNLQRLQNDAGNFASGVTYPDTAYNLGLANHRNILRKGDDIHSRLDLLDAEQILFQTSDRNNLLTSKLVTSDGAGIIDKGAITVSSLKDKIYKNAYFKFTANVPYNLIADVAANPYGYITFQTYNIKNELITLKGFPIDIGLKPASRQPYEVTLLSTPDNDLTQLIY